MITKITGVLNRVLDEEVRLQVGALEYQVLVPEFVRRRVQGSLGQRDDAAHQPLPRRQPDAGPRGAAADRLPAPRPSWISSSCSAPWTRSARARRSRRWCGPIKEIADAIQRQDSKWLTTLPGVGAATAEQIIATLRRKVTKFALMTPRRRGPARRQPTESARRR